jgi:putative ABC transport system permease protein
MDDFRTALRTLARDRQYTALAIGTLAIGLALCVTTLSVVNAYVLRGLPYPAADRLYRVDYAPPGQNPPRGLEALDWGSLGDVVEHPVAWDLDVFYLLGRGATDLTPGAWVTPGYVHALGLRTVMGRLFEHADFRNGAPAVALISHRLWQTRFGADPGVIGQPLRAYVSDRPDEPESLTIVGVLPPDLWHFNAYTEVLAPLRAPSYPYLVRIRTGVTPAAAADRIGTLVRSSVPGLADDWTPTLTSQLTSYTATVRPVLWAVGVGAALILIIAGANVAVLTLIRGRRRDRELAVRHALGATLARLTRLLALEGLAIGAAATLLGLAAARAALPMLGPAFERFLERRVPGGLDALAVDTTVVAGAAACGLLVTCIATIVPISSLGRGRFGRALTEVSRASTEGRRSGRARAVLIGIEVAASLTLVAGAGLMGRSALGMLRVDFGVAADRAVTASLSLRQRSYPEPSDRAAYYDRLLARVAGVGGSRRAALGDWWPLQGARPQRVETIADSPVIAAASIFSVSPGYFDTLGMRIRAGRDFDARDRIGGEPAVIVSESLAHQLWPSGLAVGQYVRLAVEDTRPPIDHLVVGLVSDVRQSHGDTSSLDAYVPLAQRAGRFAFLYLQQPSSPQWERQLTQAVSEVDPEVALGPPRSLHLGIEQERARPRFLAWLLTTLGGLASLLAIVGVHGAIAYAVGQRRREIAVRIAMGASGRAVTMLFLRQGFVVLALGLAAGLAGAIGIGQVLESQLFGVAPADPRVLAGAALAFLVAGLVAIWRPAMRAAQVDPAAILKDA